MLGQIASLPRAALTAVSIEWKHGATLLSAETGATSGVARPLVNMRFTAFGRAVDLRLHVNTMLHSSTYYEVHVNGTDMSRRGTERVFCVSINHPRV
jgi:hypothetical protein